MADRFGLLENDWFWCCFDGAEPEIGSDSHDEEQNGDWPEDELFAEMEVAGR